METSWSKTLSRCCGMFNVCTPSADGTTVLLSPGELQLITGFQRPVNPTGSSQDSEVLNTAYHPETKSRENVVTILSDWGQ